MSFTDFKNIFFQTESNKGFNKNKLKPALTKFLDSLDNTVEYKIIERNIAHSEMCTNINVKMTNYFCYYNKNDKCLKVSVSLPNFCAIGKKVSKDESIQDVFWTLGALVERYIVRAFVLNVITSVSIMTGDYYSFYNSSGAINRLKDKSAADNYISNLKLCCYNNNGLSNNTVPPYINKVNCLDPYVNRVIYYYLEFKYIQTQDHDFNRYCLCFDNFIDSIDQTIKRNNKISSSNRDELNKEMFKLLNISADIQKSIKQAYIIRCRYTAHPATTSWWDSADMFEEYSDRWMNDITPILKSFLDYMNAYSFYDKSINSWRDWFESNLFEIYDSSYITLMDELEKV